MTKQQVISVAGSKMRFGSVDDSLKRLPIGMIPKPMGILSGPAHPMMPSLQFRRQKFIATFLVIRQKLADRIGKRRGDSEK